MEHAPKINKVEVRTLQMADYRQLSQSFTRVYSDGSDVFWTREQIKKLITIFPEGQVVTVVDDKMVGSLSIPITGACVWHGVCMIIGRNCVKA